MRGEEKREMAKERETQGKQRNERKRRKEEREEGMRGGCLRHPSQKLRPTTKVS
ncbi:hypothetical protein D8674_038514 [Pyrus ussuriensis x Pyrus communis]|uniref:Uncharacterized protein n=1 Tax=Pyrus ussuriensis x Pyrus communis TaxID=2448454 RepID=A0A5N5FPP6_9ROSA|nr:hypothetical protein D8674_038514 [Pyrus ussuriensis x Pyrus communis]